jgi:hypothetical protein
MKVCGQFEKVLGGLKKWQKLLKFDVLLKRYPFLCNFSTFF